jgi:hypothetical protein
MVGLTREQRAARDAERNQQAGEQRDRLNEAKADPNATPWSIAGISEQQRLDERNARDERHPDWRPSTLLNIDTQEPAPDLRGIPGDQAKALNIMAQAPVAVQTDPNKLAAGPPEIVNPAAPAQSGTRVRLLRGYQPPADKEGDVLPPKRVPGEVIGVPPDEAQRLNKLGVARTLD